MTEIYEVSGLRGIAGTVRRSAPDSRSEQGHAEELRQRAALVKQRPPVDTAALSEGEMLVELVRQRMAILADYYPDFPQYRAAATMGHNALYNGLHTGPGVGAWTKVLDPVQSEMAWAIIEGKSLTAPASGWLPWELKQRTPDDGGIAIGAVPLLDCAALYPIAQPSGMPDSVYQSWVQNQYVLQNACTKENQWRTLLNDKYEKTGHHALYNFIPDANDNSLPFLVQTKAYEHNQNIWGLNTISKVSYNNLKQWQVNGILAHNIAKGAGALSPIETIEGFRQGSETGEGRGGVGSLTVAALVAIVGAITAALAAASGLILAIKGKDQSAADIFQAVAKTWANGSTDTRNGSGGGPYYTDWDNNSNTGGNNQPPDENTMTCNPGFHLENGVCVPNAPLDDDNDGGFSLGKNGLLIGAALVGGALLLGGKK